MSNLIAVVLGALISTITSWSLKAREMRWQHHRVSLERLEEMAQLAFAISAYYDRRKKIWLQRLAGYNKTPAPELIHVFELTKINGTPTAGVMKDVVQIPPFGVIEAEFVADNPFPSGPVLFHCHHQIHLDYGFAALLEYAGSSVYKQGKAAL